MGMQSLHSHCITVHINLSNCDSSVPIQGLSVKFWVEFFYKVLWEKSVIAQTILTAQDLITQGTLCSDERNDTRNVAMQHTGM